MLRDDFYATPQLTHNVQVAKLGLGSLSINLTHVATGVRTLDVLNVEVPSPVLVMGDFDPRIPGNDVGLHSQDG